MKTSIPLIMSKEEDRFFSSRSPKMKDELQILLSEVILAQQVNTPDSRRAIGKLLENWSLEMMQPQWNDFKELATRFVKNEQLLAGDLNRRCVQILDALK